MSDNQPLLDRLRAMYIPASLQLELQPRLSHEDAEQIIARITTLERELAEAKKKAAQWDYFATAIIKGIERPAATSDTVLVDTALDWITRAKAAEAQLTAANATIAACKADNDRLTDALKWLASGYTGVSSETLLFATFGIQSERNSHPYDHGDRSRCVALIRRLPWTLEGLQKLEREDKGWAAQVPLILDELKKPTPADAREAQ